MLTIPGGVQLASWLNDRVPEMIWAGLLHQRLGRENALAAFRIIASHVHDAGESGSRADATISGFSRMDPSLRQRIFADVVGPTAVKEALRPLLLFPDLPGQVAWQEAIAQDPIPSTDWDHLARAVALVADHQSQEATDLRWARVITIVATGRVHLPTRLAPMGDEILGYPNVGDMRAVRPTIRSMEGAFDRMGRDASEPSSSWPMSFWERSRTETQCVPTALPVRTVEGTTSVGTTANRVNEAALALTAHSSLTSTTTEVDARHESVFGLAAYCISTLHELLRLGNGTGILGRAGLRTILEAFLTLAYLAKKDDPALWQAYRSHGSGQAKLAFLKLDELTEISAADLPSSVNLGLLEALANEDRWQEFVEINVGHWDASNLRKTSVEAGEKATYDRFYGWASSFVHANWAAVRICEFDLCANPLHRWHRVLRASGLALGDVVPDAAMLVDSALAVVDRLYPTLSARVSVPTPLV